MNSWIIVLIVVLSYMLLITINNIIKDNSNNYDVSNGDIFLGGVFTWLLILIKIVGTWLFNQIKETKYKALIQDTQGNIYYCSSRKVDKIVNNTDMHWVEDREQFKSDMKYWNKKFCHNSNPNIRYAPKQVWKRYKKYKGQTKFVEKVED